jgi:outer membrane murein-binding lipoprotein Lpp
MEPDAAREDSPMEARIARIESDIAHLNSDVGEIKLDLRTLRDKVDELGTGLNGKIDALDTRLSGKIDQLRNEISSAKVWALMLYMSLAALNFGALARAFGWL